MSKIIVNEVETNIVVAQECVSTYLIGEPKPWTSEILPSSRWMWCKGASLLRSSYPDLWSKWYVNRGDVSISNANPAVVTLNSHGFLTGSCVSLVTTGSLPLGLSVDTEYFVIEIDDNSFNLASTLDFAIAGTKLATTSAGSGTHTIYSNPYGFEDSTHFYLPDYQGRVLKASGSYTISGRTKTAPALGVSEEDGFQGHKHYYGYYVAGSSGGATSFLLGSNVTGTNGDAVITSPINDGTNGVPRYGLTTRENSIGINYIVRVI